MEKPTQKKQQLIEKMADHLLQHGLSSFTLRSLGAATGTSDRMLLHYFVDKEELLTSTLLRVAERLILQLRAVQPGTMGPQQLIAFLAAMLKDAGVLPFTNLWLELTSMSIRAGDPYRRVASQISDAFLEWIAATLEPVPGGDHAATSAYILAVVEGMVVLQAVGQDTEVQQALSVILRTP